MESLRGLTSSPASAYDELVTGQKSIRYHWQGILSVIRALPGGLGERVESARRQLEESGATVNLLDDRGAPRWTLRSAALRGRARRMGRARDRPDPARPPARCRAGRSLRPADAAEAAPAAADAGPRQPALPAALPGHRRRGADAPSRPVRRRPGAAGRRALACAGRPHRGAVRHRLCAGDAPRAGAQPARGVPLHPGAPSQAVRRPLARFAARHGAGGVRQPQHGGADAGLAVGDLFRACLSRARARRAAGRGRRSRGARRRGVDQDAGRPAPRPHAAAPPRQRLRRSAGAARRFGAGRHRPGRDHAQRQDHARQRAGLGRRRDAGDDAVPRAAERAPARPAARPAVARRVVAGRAGGASPSRSPTST